MINKFLPKSDFARNTITLMTGTTIAQAIPIVISPILTRIYTPKDFGLLAIFLALTIVLGSIANGRYELAIMLPEKDEDAINIAALGLLIASTFSLVLLIGVILFNEQIALLLDETSINIWLYFIPLVVWIMGVYNVLNYLNTRKKLYKNISKAAVYKSTVMVTTQLFIGMLKSGVSGLILGQILAQIAANIQLIKSSTRQFNISDVNFIKIKSMAIRYVKFPKFSMWAILANNLSTHLVNLFIPMLYSITTLGVYSLTQKILGLPSAVIGTSIGQVYFQQATAEKLQTGLSTKTFNATLKKLTIISILFFPVLYILAPFLFEIVFGIEWRIAGEYAQILIPLFAIRFIVAALTLTNSLFEKQAISLVWQIVLLVLSLATIAFSHYHNYSFIMFLEIHNIVISTHYIILLVLLYYVSKGKF